MGVGKLHLVRLGLRYRRRALPDLDAAADGRGTGLRRWYPGRVRPVRLHHRGDRVRDHAVGAGDAVAARGREHPEGRSSTLRYAAGVTAVQLAWIGRLWLAGVVGWIGFAVLVAAELGVPVWAEFAGRSTPWHPGHITERYALFTIIVLGEVISAIAIAVQSALAAGGVAGPGLLTAAAGGLLLVFALWWSYFKHSAITQIRRSLPWTFVWALGHYLVFSAVAAVGAGLQVVVDTLTHADHVGSVFAAFTVAIPVAVFLIVLGLLNTRMSDQPTAIGPILLTAVLVLAAAATTRIVTLPLSIMIMIMVVLVALLLAYHLAAAHRTALMIKS